MKPEIGDLKGYSKRELAELYRAVFEVKGAQYELISREFNGYPVLEASDEDRLFSLVLIWGEKDLKDVDEIEREVHEFVNQSGWDGSTSLTVYITTLSKISQGMDSLLSMRFGGLRFNPQFYGFSWLQENLNKYNGLFQKWKKSIEKSKQITHPRHALSTDENDLNLVSKGYQNQGLIGFVYSNDIGEESIPLTQVLLNSSKDYFYYLHRRNETFSDNDTSEEKVIGYLSLSRNSGANLELNRYKREEGSFLDHFYCSQPNEDQLRAYNYKREERDFQNKYLLPEAGEDLEALYVYSNRPEIRFFSSLLEEESQEYSSREEAEELIASKSDSNFWWVNANESKFSPVKDKGYKIEVFRGKKESKEIKPDDIVLVCSAELPKRIYSIFSVIQVNKGNEKLISFMIRGRYKFKTPFNLSEYPELEVQPFLKGIVHKIPEELFQEIINATELGYQIDDEITHIQNTAQKTKIDNDGAMAPKDFLGFENDIRAFSITLAQKRLVPPVAVALFGNWGTGKSFFMHHLEKNIKRLSEFQSFYGSKAENKPGLKPFCEGVVHIKFNAWSYLDTNLWAGLIATIFEKLDEYVSGENVIEKEKQKAQKIIADKLDIVAHEKENLKVEINKLTSKQELLAKELKKMQANKKSMYDSVVSKTIEDLKKEAKKETSEIEAKVKEQLDQYGISKQRVDELSPSALLDELTTWVTFVKHLGKFNKPQLRIGIGLVFLLGWFAIDPGNYLAELKQQINNNLVYMVGIGGGLFSKCYDSFSRFKKLFTPVIDYKNRFNESFERIKLNYDQSLLTLSNQLEASNSEILDQERKLSEVEQKIEKYNHALEHSVTKRAFFDFIKRKANEESYESHLGLISIIRRDFEKLSGLFEEVNIPEDAMPEVKEELVEKKKENEKFRELFSKPLDRIILYIDDLDRCDDDKVLEVLEAVHLLMAFPLFIVIVGVDKRCVSNALRYRNILKYTSMAKASPKQLKDDYNIEVIEPEEYLEKIFQIPFRLKAAKPEAIKGLIGNLLKNEIEVIEEIEEEDEEQGEKEDHKVREKEAKSTIPKPKPKSKPTEPANVAPEDLLITQTELDYLKEVSIVVGDTPRTIKRFINIYRIIRAHEQLNYRRKEKDLDFLIIMFVLGLGIGNQRDMSSIIFDNCMTNESKNLKDVLELNKETKSLVVDIETSETLKQLLSVSASQFNNYIYFVNRFSFA
jgi:hypothetical protein